MTLQDLDANCNNCKRMVRDFELLRKHKESYAGTGKMDNLQYGNCAKLGKPVSFIPNTCQIETQGCFENRKPLLTI